jgi:hypothetical protein
MWGGDTDARSRDVRGRGGAVARRDERTENEAIDFDDSTGEWHRRSDSKASTFSGYVDAQPMLSLIRFPMEGDGSSTERFVNKRVSPPTSFHCRPRRPRFAGASRSPGACIE